MFLTFYSSVLLIVKLAFSSSALEQIEHLNVAPEPEIELDYRMNRFEYAPDPPPIFSKSQSPGKTWPPSSIGDFAVNFVSMYRLLENEHRFHNLLDYLNQHIFAKYPEQFKNLQPHVNSYLNDYEEELLEPLRRLEDATFLELDHFAAISHPFLLLWTLHRAHFRIKPIFGIFQEMQLSERIFNETGLCLANLPGTEDFHDFEQLLRNIHYTYDGDISEFTSGEFGTFDTDIRLDPTTLVRVGVAALKDKFYFTAIQWFHEAHTRALKIVAAEDTVKTQRLRRLAEQSLEAAITEHDLEWSLDVENNPNVYIQKIGENLGRIRYSTPHKILLQEKIQKFRKFPEKFLAAAIAPMCQGQSWLTAEEEAELVCWFDARVPIFPFKVELIHKSPKVIHIHQFISKQSANDLIQWAYPRLSTTSEEVKGQGNTLHTLRGTAAFMGPKYSRYNRNVAKLEAHMEFLTRLEVRSDPDDQVSSAHVTSFIPGGYFVPKYNKKETTDTTALGTFNIHLHQGFVLGGCTVFPSLGVFVHPEPGSAVFWENISRGTHHAQCPVVMGRKWVFTKIIRQKGTESCPLHE